MSKGSGCNNLFNIENVSSLQDELSITKSRTVWTKHKSYMFKHLNSNIHNMLCIMFLLLLLG